MVQSHLSSKVIETWLNETIVASSHLEIPGIILKPEHKKPLSRYGIDRNQLLQGNIPHHQIDRIYRALFVYSLGFYEMLSKVLSGSTQKNIFQSALWKVFAILLEYCCKTNYKMLITQITAAHKEQLDAIEKEFSECQDRLYHNEKEM